jgi:hypothetical protein
MSDVLSEGVVIRMAPQPTLGTTPTAEWTQMQPDKGSIQGMKRENQTVERNINDPYMGQRKGRVVGWSVKPQFAHDFNKDYADIMAEAAFRCVGAHPGGKGQRKYRSTAVSTSAWTVAANGDLAAGTLVKARGFTNSANNGIFKLTTGSTTTSIKTGSTLVAEASPPENATVGVWGFEGASGDLEIDASGNLISTTEDFTTRGIQVGSLVQIGDPDTANCEFATLGVFYAWVTKVAAHQVTLEGHALAPGVSLAADDGDSKTIRVRLSSLYRNYAITDASYAKKRLFIEFELPNAGSDGTSRWITVEGLAVDKMDIAAPLKQKITATVSFVGTNASKALALADRQAAGTGRGDSSRTAFAPLAVQLSDTANDVKFVRILDAGANLVGKVNNWTVTIANNVTPLEAQGTPGAVEHIYGAFGPTAKFEVYFDNSDQIDVATDNDDLSADACIDNGEFMWAWRFPRTALRADTLQIQANTQVTMSTDAPGFLHETTNVANVLCIFE